MSVKYNRCTGCDYYDGFHEDYVLCQKKKRVKLDKGCDLFTPDITASCYDQCYFNSGRDDLGNIKCSKYNTTYSQGKKYCEGYAEKWEGMSSSNKGKWFFIIILILAIYFYLK